MSGTKVTEDGWTREFQAHGREMDEVEAEARAYEEGLHDGAPGKYEVEWDDSDWGIELTVREKKAPEPKLWIWNWIGLGYNSCRADSREEALVKAAQIADGTNLKVDESTLRECTVDELRAEERRWGPYD